MANSRGVDVNILSIMSVNADDDDEDADSPSVDDEDVPSSKKED